MCRKEPVIMMTKTNTLNTMNTLKKFNVELTLVQLAKLDAELEKEFGKAYDKATDSIMIENDDDYNNKFYEVEGQVVTMAKAIRDNDNNKKECMKMNMNVYVNYPYNTCHVLYPTLKAAIDAALAEYKTSDDYEAGSNHAIFVRHFVDSDQEGVHGWLARVDTNNDLWDWGTCLTHEADYAADGAREEDWDNDWDEDEDLTVAE